MAIEEQEREKREPIFKDIRRYYCDFCGICRSKKSLLAAHVLSEHQEEIEEREIEEDEEMEGQKSENICEECGESFKKPAHLKQHMICHSDERPFVCPLDHCQKRFRRRDHLNRHLLQHEGMSFKCPIEGCDKQFNLQSNLKRHLKEVHEEKPAPRPSNVAEQKKYVCPEVGCGKEFSCQSNMNKHVKRMHEGKPIPSHGKGQKKHVCQKIGCGKEFNWPSQLRAHEETHAEPDSSEAICADCAKPFANIKCLREHVRSCHQYVSCEVCGSKHLKKNIKRHLRTHEECSSETESETEVETIKCSFEGCDHSFTTKSNLQQHVKAVHLNLRPFICKFPGCGMRFAFKHVRDNHERTGRHVYVNGNLEEFDEQFRSMPRGGQKRKYPNVEMLMRKRITPPNEGDDGVLKGSDYISWLLSTDDAEL